MRQVSYKCEYELDQNFVNGNISAIRTSNASRISRILMRLELKEWDKKCKTKIKR